MSAKNFKFVSPGVFIEEIDNSQLPQLSDAIGPVVIGRSRRGPAFLPTTVQSFSEFVTIFGDPVAGQEASDQWRSGVPKAPTFAAYAAQAWLKNSSPLTFIRLLGDQSSKATNETTAKAGWSAADASQNNGGTAAHGGGAYGLFLIESGSSGGTLGPTGTPEIVSGTLAAVIYTRYGAPVLSGSIRGEYTSDAGAAATRANVIDFDSGVPTSGQSFTIALPAGYGTNGGKTFEVLFKSTGTDFDATPTANQVFVKIDASKSAMNDNFQKVFNGGAASVVKFGDNVTDGTASGVGSLAAVDGGDTVKTTINASLVGTLGNSVTLANVDIGGATVSMGALAGGEATDTSGQGIATGSNVLIKSLDGTPNYSFKLRIVDKDGYAGGTTSPANPQGILEETVINFNRSSNNYIRKVLNTDPTKTNTSLVNTTSDNAKSYFLGQTYERSVRDFITGSSCYGVILQLGGETNVADGGSFKYATQAAQTGWFFSQDLRNTAGSAVADDNKLSPPYNPESAANVVDRLFKFHTISTGEEEQRRYKISIEDIRYSKNDNAPYGSFTVAIRDIADNDGARVYVERYAGCSLDPSSPNYLAKKIGDRYYQWSEAERRVIEYGTYPNVSNIVRVEMATAVDASQTNPEALPFGNEGPVKYKDFKLSCVSGDFSAETSVNSPVVLGSGSTYPQNFGAVTGSDNQVKLSAAESYTQPLSASVHFPEVPLRLSASTGEVSNQIDAYFGAEFVRSSGSVVYDTSMQDVTYPLAAGGQAFSPVAGETETSWYFSLDDIVDAGGTTAALGSVFYQSGSRELGSSKTAMTGTYKAILDAGFDQFTAPFFGGFNGFDITEQEPFNHLRALPAGASEAQYAMAYSVRKGIDMFADPEFVEGNILTAPGIVNEGLTTHMINTCEGRGDALALVDPKGGYEPFSEGGSNGSRTEQERISATHVNDVVNNMTSRALNSSYGAVYYPWIRISDTITGASLWAPPSVAAFGAMSFNDKQTAPWFAPAGFNRGGLSAGAAGIPVTNVRSKLTSKERDSLYDANINPIASFPNEGIVIFGQKTLQVTPSALDRINVRRLMIFVKKEISRIASNLLFEPNVQATWDKFTSEVNPFLNNIKNQFGLDDFKVVLDETTTTPDLIDRNVVYAKIFLKPTKAVEFFAIDFVITNSGAGFED